MIMPVMRGANSQKVSIPLFKGGIGSAFGGSAMSDNQLTDCKNVWARNGEVITRPKIDKTDKKIDGEVVKEIETFFEGRKIKIFISEKSENKEYIVIVLSADNKIFAQGEFSASSANNNFILIPSHKTGDENAAYVIFLNSNNTVIFGIKVRSEIQVEINQIEDDEIYIPTLRLNGLGDLYGNLPKTDEAEKVVTVQPEAYNLLNNSYKAYYMSDSISTRFFLPTLPKNEATIKIKIDVSRCSSGQAFIEPPEPEEGSEDGMAQLTYGGASGFYKCKDTSNDINDENKVDILEFTIPPYSVEALESYIIDGTFPHYSTDGTRRADRTYFKCKFTAKVIKDDGIIFFPFIETDKGFFGELTYNPDPTTSNVDKDTLNKYLEKLQSSWLVFYDNYEKDLNNGKEKEYYIGKVHIPKFTTYYEPNVQLRLPRNNVNNIEITVIEQTDPENIRKITDCNITTSYVGSGGINAGTRNFVSGKDNTVYFSDVGKPLYFPENCYFAVGNRSEKVTGFAEMDGRLVIFKENSIYYTYEVALEEGGKETKDKLTGQSIIDLTSRYKYTIYSLNSEVGCNIPKSIQLCMNRLIFANKDGNIYTISSLNNYSEKNIYSIGNAVRNRIKRHSEDEVVSAVSADWQGYYMLFVGNECFLMDYNRNSYKYIYSYTSDNKSEKLFNWWIWEVPKLDVLAFTNEFLVYKSGDDVLEIDISKYEDESESFIVSKFFDFSYPDIYKSIDKIQFEVGNEYDSDILVGFLTDGKTKDEIPIKVTENGTRGTAYYGKEVVIYPKIRNCRKFGFKITANKPFSIISVNINFTPKGGVKNGI